MLVTPLQWIGTRPSPRLRRDDVAAPPRTYLDPFATWLDNFLAHGFRRIVVVNGHGGTTCRRNRSFELRQKYRERQDLLLLFGTYWLLGQPTPMTGFVQDHMGHACEWETSMMLRLAPHLVGEYLKTELVPFGTPFEPATRGWTTPDRSGPGHIGDPRAASARKGEQLFGRFAADAVAGILKRVIAWDGRSWSG